MAGEIHSTAIVDSKAQLGEDVRIGAYSIIGPSVKLGDRTWVGPHVVIEGITTIGEESEIFQFASLGSKPQDLKFQGEPSTLEIGARNKIREYVTIQPGTRHGHMRTVVGDNNLFMANSHIGHDCAIGSNNVFANSAGLAGHVTIHNNVILGGMVGIHQFCRIGDFVIISAGSMVGGDIPPGCIGQGDRCHLRGVNVIGLERGGFSASEIAGVRKAYRLLFGTAGHLKKKIVEFPQDLRAQLFVGRMLAFIESSERGVCFPAKTLSDSEK